MPATVRIPRKHTTCAPHADGTRHPYDTVVKKNLHAAPVAWRARSPARAIGLRSIATANARGIGGCNRASFAGPAIEWTADAMQ